MYLALRELVLGGAEMPAIMPGGVLDDLRSETRDFVLLNAIPGSVALVQSVMAASPIKALLRQIVKIPFVMETVSYARLVVPSAEFESHWHVDAQFSRAPSYTIWIPLDECGIDAPAIRFAPVGEGFFASADFQDIVEDLAVRRWIDGRELVQPHFRVGDVAIFDGQCVHGTNASPKMRNQRISIDLRLNR